MTLLCSGMHAAAFLIPIIIPYDHLSNQDLIEFCRSCEDLLYCISLYRIQRNAKVLLCEEPELPFLFIQWTPRT